VVVLYEEERKRWKSLMMMAREKRGVYKY